MAATSCTCHAIWSRRLLKEINLPKIEVTMICVDNKFAQALAKNPVYHDRSKHIGTRYHFIRECIAKKEGDLKYVKCHDQVADIFTKPLRFEDFQRLRSNLGVKKKQKIKGDICGNKILATINLAAILVEITSHKCENW